MTKTKYATLVCPNGQILKFRLQDNRFKAYFVTEGFDDDLDIDFDDCSGEELATIIRLLMELP